MGCPAGSYCGRQGLKTPQGLCGAGFYCPKRSLIQNSIVCPAGYYCPEGASEPTKCEGGTYTVHLAQRQCFPCPAGYYCSSELRWISFPLICPIGRACPAGSSEPIVCAANQYSIKMGR